MTGEGEIRGGTISWDGWRFHSLLSAGLLSGALVSNSLDLLTTWHISSRIGGQELNLLQSAILSKYGFVALAVYKGWIISGFLVLLYLCSTRDWKGRGLSVVVFTGVTILLSGIVAWNVMQILKVAGLQF